MLMLEIAGGIVLGGIILFIMAAFAEELIKLALWVVGIIAAILVIIAVAYVVGSSLAVAGVQPDDRFADGLFALVPLVILIALAIKLPRWTKEAWLDTKVRVNRWRGRAEPSKPLPASTPTPEEIRLQERRDRRAILRIRHAGQINSGKQV